MDIASILQQLIQLIPLIVLLNIVGVLISAALTIKGRKVQASISFLVLQAVSFILGPFFFLLALLLLLLTIVNAFRMGKEGFKKAKITLIPLFFMNLVNCGVIAAAFYLLSA